MKKFIITALIVLLMGAGAKAQTLTDYTWDSYKTKFKIGTDWKVEESTATSFSAGNHDIMLSIYPRTGGHNDYSELLTGLKAWAAKSGATEDSKGFKELTDLNGYHGCMMDGTYNNGSQQCFMMNVVDPQYTDIHLYVWIAYNTTSYSVAEKVLKSFTPN
jgi:hypothetical protein